VCNLSKSVPALFGVMCAIHVMAVSYNFQAMSFIKLFGILSAMIGHLQWLMRVTFELSFFSVQL